MILFVHLNKMFVLCIQQLYNKCTSRYQFNNEYIYAKCIRYDYAGKETRDFRAPERG